MVRLAVARLHFCSNSFNPVRTRLDDMRAHEWRTGAEALAQWRPGTELDGLAAFLAERPGWQATLLRAAAAPPGGPLHAEVFGAWLADVEAGLAKGRFDAVYLSLHGACQAEGDPTADLTVLRRVRSVVGRVPVVASFHSTANLSEETVLLLDGATGVSPVPGGAHAAARRALHLLEGLIAGHIRPVGALARVPSLLPSLGAPLVLPEIWEHEVAPPRRGVLDASAFAGFPWADSRLAGASAMVWTDRDAGLARATAARLANRLAVAPRIPSLWQPAAALAAGREAGGRFALLDPSDDPRRGGLADTPGLLAALAAGPLPGPAAFGVLYDPTAVAAAREAGVGGTLERAFGARLTGDYGAPLPLRVTVERLVEESGAAPPVTGAIAVLRHGNLAILVAELRPPQIGLDLLARAGIVAAQLAVLALKAGGMPDLRLAEAFPEVLTCACPGPGSANLLGLPFHDVPVSRRAA